MYAYNHFTSYHTDRTHFETIGGLDEAFDDIDQETIESLIDEMREALAHRKTVID